MSTVRYFRFDDPGAPVLTGRVGSLTNLLRRCLVGTNGIAYEQKPSAGWTEAFVGSGGNIAVFRNNPAQGFSGCYVHVNDNAPDTASGATEARLRVYATMSALNTGTAATKIYYVRKSSDTTTTPRNWMLAADGGTAWLYTWATGDSNFASGDGNIAFFGDYESIVQSGAFRYMASARVASNWGSGYGTQLGTVPNGRASIADVLQVAPLNGIGSPVLADLMLPLLGTTTYTGVGGQDWPAAPDVAGNRAFLGGPMIRTTSGFVGRLRGLQIPFQRLDMVAAGDTVPEAPHLRVMRANYATSLDTETCVALDVVGPW